MTTLEETVDEEALNEELEHLHDEEAAEAEPAPEPEPEPADEEPEALLSITPEQIAKAERARSAQQKRLAGILGEGYVEHECIFCTGLGFTPEPPPLGATFTVVSGEDGPTFEVQAALSDIPLLQAPDKQACDECDGYGEVLSGSRAPHAMVVPCTRCAGNGWVMVARELPIATVAPAVDGGPRALDTPDLGALGADAWGRPQGHKHWGVPPASIPG